MRLVLQRVSAASVAVDGEVVGSIEGGLLALVGIEAGDGEAEMSAAAEKIAGLRIFSDASGAMNLSIEESGGSVLLVSQFTLLADLKKGRRPSFSRAAPPETAAPLVERLRELIEEEGIHTEVGRFGARMKVSLVNEGPVTLVVDFRGGRVV